MGFVLFNIYFQYEIFFNFLHFKRTTSFLKFQQHPVIYFGVVVVYLVKTNEAFFQKCYSMCCFLEIQ